MSPLLMPLAVFLMVVLIVAIVAVARIRELEIRIQQDLHLKSIEHQRKIRELDAEIERIKQQS